MKGNPAIYRKRVTKPAIDTAVLVLLDRSSSMRKLDRIAVARFSTLAAVAGLLDIPGLAVAAAAYPGHSSKVDLLTRFGEPLRRTASRYAAVTASGGTPLLVTDGEPFEKNTCREAIHRCWAGGIETLGLGIRVSTIADIFPVCACIDEVSELAAAMFGLLQAVLIRKTG